MDLNKDKFDFNDVLELIGFLRSENGCPWDRVQTHKSLSKNAIEEAYELENAVENNNLENMIEEIGDLLMQVALHISIAEESGEFSAGDVYTRLCKKLISRHTHVFGDVKAKDAKDALKNWEAQKKIEHKTDSVEKYILDIPNNMSALMKTQKTQSRAGKGGYTHSSVENAFADLNSELLELSAEIKDGIPEKIADEGGDVLFAAVNVLRMLGVDSETALLRSNRKFVNRVLKCEMLLRDRGETLLDLSADEFDTLWKKAKECQ